MNFPLFIIMASLAVWQIVEIIHHSVLAVPLREWAGRTVSADSDWSHPLSFVAHALGCPFCLSNWVAGAVTLCWISRLHYSVPLWLVCAFATARLANLGNDLTYSYGRTPKLDEEEDDDAID